MTVAAWTLSLLILLGALAYLRVPLIGSSLFVTAWLTTLTMSGATWWALVPFWLVWIGLATLLNVTPLRRRWISDPVLRVFRTVLPTMSGTEREALEAGNVWWDAELFSGRPRWRRLLESAAPGLTEREQAFLDGPVETLCRMLDDWRITHHDHDLPAEVWRFIKQQGFFGMIIPRSFGGLGFS
ncbi:MAG: acyl-CoA dehydrogenase, partial [Gammaproteobacteria bacterium]